MGSENKKKYLRRMTAASLCAVVLCLAVMVSATLAYFEVSVTNSGNVITVGDFEAEAAAVPAVAMLDEDAKITNDDGFYPKGRYYLNLTWDGSVDGHIVVDLVPAVNSSTSEEKRYVIALEKVEGGCEVRLNLTLYEDTFITYTSSWGIPEEHMTLETAAEEGLTFGKMFEVEINDTTELEKSYGAGEHKLYLDWISEEDGYCVVRVDPAEGEEAEPVEYYVKLPATNGEERLEIITMNLRQPGVVTASAHRGQPDEAKEVTWLENSSFNFGTHFVVSTVIGATGENPAGLTDSIYEAGEYQLSLDWSDSSAAGYCVITVTSVEEGSETEQAVYFLICDQTETSCAINLTLHEAATIEVATGKGSFTGTAFTVPEGGIVFGTEKTEEDESSNESSTENQDNTGTDGDQNQNGDSVPDPTSSDETVDEPAEGGQQTGDEPGAGNE